MSWRPVTDIDASFDRLRQLKEQMKGHNDAAEARLKASEDRVAKLLKENAELRKRLQQGFHFTADQMKEHDSRVARQAREVARQNIVKAQVDAMEAKYAEHLERFDKESKEHWQALEDEFRKGSDEENFMEWLKYMWSIPIAVLVEKFHWKPVTKGCGDNRQNLVKFCNECVNILEEIKGDELKSIQAFSEQVLEKYGASFMMEE